VPNKVYRAIDSPITFKDSGGSAVITLQNLATGAARYSSRYDRGVGSQPFIYRWRAVFQWAATPVAGQFAEIYIAESDGTYADGVIGTTDAAIQSGMLWNLNLIGVNFIQSASAATNMIASGECEIIDRYFSLAVYNRAAVGFQNTANVNCVIFTPISDELQ